MAQAETTSYTYDEARADHHNVGQMTTLANAAAVIEQDYDAAQRLVHKRYIVDGTTYGFQTGYDLGGRLLWQSYPDGDMVGTAGNPITYDGAGRFKASPALITGITYDASRAPQPCTRCCRERRYSRRLTAAIFSVQY